MSRVGEQTALNEEVLAFEALQEHLAPMYREVFPDPLEPRTVVVVPSLSLDPGELAKISGVHHYEERMLCMLMLLRLPRTQVIYLSSQPLDPTVIDYMLHLLAGVPAAHARQRLHLFSCHDAAPDRCLTAKVLERPRLIERVRNAMAYPQRAHMACFNATALERTLALRLGIPLYACDPRLDALGTKSGSREIFREAGIEVPPGFEHLRDVGDVIEALASLRRGLPELRRAVVKLNEGFSGEGNAVFDLSSAPTDQGLEAWLREHLPTGLRFEAASETWDHFLAMLEGMGGIVEAFVEGEGKVSPSVQCRINPLGEPSVISTHDQVLGGPSGQVFLGCTFPASEDYRLQIQEAGQRVGRVLAARGVLGRFGVDFVSIPEGDGWRHQAIEINLRKGGTTHPFMMLQFLTDGRYDQETGLFFTPAGQARFYRASDNLQDPALRGLTPQDLIDITVCERLHFHGATQEGVVFHLIGALSEFGKLGLVCIGASPERASELYERTVRVLDRQANNV